jgi:hypothetical protein
MKALFKFVVLLAIFFLQPMSNPTNKPSCEPIREPINDQTINQIKQRLEQDALLPLLSSIHQCNKTCNAFRMIAYFGFQPISTKQRQSRLRFQRSPTSTLQQHHIGLGF